MYLFVWFVLFYFIGLWKVIIKNVGIISIANLFMFCLFFFKLRKILTKNVGHVSVVSFIFYFDFFLGLENSKMFFIKINFI